MFCPIFIKFTFDNFTSPVGLVGLVILKFYLPGPNFTSLGHRACTIFWRLRNDKGNMVWLQSKFQINLEKKITLTQYCGPRLHWSQFTLAPDSLYTNQTHTNFLRLYISIPLPCLPPLLSPVSPSAPDFWCSLVLEHAPQAQTHQTCNMSYCLHVCTLLFELYLLCFLTLCHSKTSVVSQDKTCQKTMRWLVQPAGGNHILIATIN